MVVAAAEHAKHITIELDTLEADILLDLLNLAVITYNNNDHTKITKQYVSHLYHEIEDQIGGQR